MNLHMNPGGVVTSKHLPLDVEPSQHFGNQGVV